MRRTTTVASAVTVLVPLLLAGAPAASAAGKGSLTVTTLDRGGKPVYAQVAVYNTKTNDFRYIESNKAASLPNGSYELVTSFTDAAGGHATVGGHSVTVSGATKTTFDARQGRPVNVSLSPGPGSGYDHTVSAYVCAADNGPASMGISAEAGDLYVIPSSSKAYELSYGTAYQPRSTTGGDFWLASATHKGGVPSGVSATLKQSGLTTLKVSARSGPDSGQAMFSFDYSSDGDSCSWGPNTLQFQRDLPNSFSAHLPPGQWSVGQHGHDFAYDGAHTYAVSKTTSLPLGRAVWGPGGRLPNTWYKQLYFGSINPFADPTLPAGGILAAWFRQADPRGQDAVLAHLQPLAGDRRAPRDPRCRLVHAHPDRPPQPAVRLAVDHVQPQPALLRGPRQEPADPGLHHPLLARRARQQEPGGPRFHHDRRPRHAAQRHGRQHGAAAARRGEVGAGLVHHRQRRDLACRRREAVRRQVDHGRPQPGLGSRRSALHGHGHPRRQLDDHGVQRLRRELTGGEA